MGGFLWWSAGGSVAASVEVDGVRGVDEPVENALGDDGVGEERIPVFGSSVRGQDERSAGSFGDEFVDVVGVAGGEFSHREIVEHEHVGFRPFP